LPARVHGRHRLTWRRNSSIDRHASTKAIPALKILGLSILALIGGYFVGLVAGYALVNRFSPNRHDKSVETATTAAFVVGPACAGIALLTTLAYLLLRSDE
jgi:ABC-type sulfate transport system permease component